MECGWATLSSNVLPINERYVLLPSVDTYKKYLRFANPEAVLYRRGSSIATFNEASNRMHHSAPSDLARASTWDTKRRGGDEGASEQQTTPRHEIHPALPGGPVVNSGKPAGALPQRGWERRVFMTRFTVGIAWMSMRSVQFADEAVAVGSAPRCTEYGWMGRRALPGFRSLARPISSTPVRGSASTTSTRRGTSNTNGSARDQSLRKTCIVYAACASRRLPNGPSLFSYLPN